MIEHFGTLPPSRNRGMISGVSRGKIVIITAAALPLKGSRPARSWINHPIKNRTLGGIDLISHAIDQR